MSDDTLAFSQKFFSGLQADECEAKSIIRMRSPDVSLLCVETNPGMLSIMEKELANYPFMFLDFARSEEEGMKMVRRGRYSHMLIDFDMPRTMGIPLAERALFLNRNQMVMMLSNFLGWNAVAKICGSKKIFTSRKPLTAYSVTEESDFWGRFARFLQYSTLDEAIAAISKDGIIPIMEIAA